MRVNHKGPSCPALRPLCTSARAPPWKASRASPIRFDLFGVLKRPSKRWNFLWEIGPVCSHMMGVPKHLKTSTNMN